MRMIGLVALLGAFLLPAVDLLPAQIASPAAACSPGSDPEVPGPESNGSLWSKSGLTPQKVKGATTVSPREAECLQKFYGVGIIILAPLPDTEEQLFLAVPIQAWGNAGTLTDATQSHLVREMDLATAKYGGKARPILTYCHHESCRLSYNLTVRLVAAGYTNVYWMRSGIAGWKKAGYPTVLPLSVRRALGACTDSARAAISALATTPAADGTSPEVTRINAQQGACMAAAGQAMLTKSPDLAPLFKAEVQGAERNLVNAAISKRASIEKKIDVQNSFARSLIPDAPTFTKVGYGGSVRSDGPTGGLAAARFDGAVGDLVTIVIAGSDPQNRKQVQPPAGPVHLASHEGAYFETSTSGQQGAEWVERWTFRLAQSGEHALRTSRPFPFVLTVRKGL